MPATAEPEQARGPPDPAFERLVPWTTGRALNVAFGAGDRTRGLYGPATHERLAGPNSQHDPANLFRRNYDVTGRSRPDVTA
ncbi:hypothetical protein [Streptomyces sp. 142MFCol3.1]|uniref:hypothetical protein n=1 Tax=Streptomyces sp. 142MFCol3.1 TaxID=1172179 RepID=UPI0004271EC5|nr:hypothetical protein [Streptomyces sp. 142MFCol3.1]